MKKRILSLILALVMLVGLVPAAAIGVSAEAADLRVDSGITMGSSGGNGATNPASAAVDTSVDYCSILGISKATAEKFGKRIRDSFRKYDFDVSLSGITINLNNTSREKNAFAAMLENEVFFQYDTFMFEVVTYNYYRDNKSNVTRIVFDKDDLLTRYKKDYTNYLADLTAVHTIASQLMDGIKGNDALTDVKKALLLHDRLAQWNRYDYDNYKTKSLPDESYTIVGALWKQVSVCQGYAEAYAYMLDQCGIENRFAQSSQLNHIWNIVTLNGIEFYVDVTWDDPSQYDLYGQVLHDNFLISYKKLYYDTEHKATDYPVIKDNTELDNAFWVESRTAFQLIGDADVYYLDNQEEEGACYARLYRWTDNMRYQTMLFNDATQMKWTWHNGSYWTDRNYACLASWQGKLYVNGATGIYEYDPVTGAISICFTPGMPTQYASIYGFAIFNGRFMLNLQNNWATSEDDARSKRYYYDPKKISYIEVYQRPDQTAYKVNDPYDFSGMTLKATYTDGTTALIKNALDSYSYQTTSTTGTKTITVGLFDKKATFTLNVIKGLSTPKVTVANDKKGITVSWGKVNYAQEYIVYRSTYSGGKWSDWTRVTLTTKTSYTNQSPKNGTVYRYAVYAYHGNLRSSLGESGSIRRLATPTAKVANATSGTYVSWNKVTGAKNYLVYRATYKNGKWSDWTRVTTTTKTTYTDKSAKSNTLYKYLVKAANGSSKSAGAQTGTIRRLTASTVTAKKSGKTIKLSWTAVAGKKHYVVYRRIAGTSTWTKLYTTKTRAYVDTTAKAGKYYEYAVRAVCGDSMSAYKACKKVKR